MLTLPTSAHAALRQHGEQTYPHECCGVLLGRFEDNGDKTVTRAVGCGNTRDDSPHNRYNIDPRELIRIQREGRARSQAANHHRLQAAAQGRDAGAVDAEQAADAAKTSSASTTRTPTIRRGGPAPISPKPTGSAAPT